MRPTSATGSKLRDATGAQCRNVDEWLLAIADQLQPHGTPTSREQARGNVLGRYGE